MGLTTACTEAPAVEDDNPADLCADVVCEELAICNPLTGTCESAAIEPECEADSDCADGTMRCDEGQCVAKCEGVVCDGAGEVCDPTTGACVGGNGCESDDDCGENSCEDGQCVAGRLTPCTSNLPCSEGLECVQGPVSLCVEPCAADGECSAIEYCMTPDRVPIAPMAAFTNYCFPNLCQPGGDAFGVYQDTEYLAACSVHEDGDEGGRCIGPLNEDGLGICASMIDGQAGLGESCIFTADQGSEDACDGAFCVELILDGTCTQLCNVFDGSVCDDGTMGANACLPSFTLGNGLCIPAFAAVAAGESCDPGTETGAPCVHGYTCAPINSDGTENICVAWCNPNAGDDESNGCADGESCLTDVSGLPVDVGVCGPTP